MTKLIFKAHKKPIKQSNKKALNIFSTVNSHVHFSVHRKISAGCYKKVKEQKRSPQKEACKRHQDSSEKEKTKNINILPSWQATSWGRPLKVITSGTSRGPSGTA